MIRKCAKRLVHRDVRKPTHDTPTIWLLKEMLNNDDF